MVEEIPEYKLFGSTKFRRAGAWKSRVFAEKRAQSLRDSGWNVRTVSISTSHGTRYVNYRR